jgi:proteasome beta subunit
MAVDGPEGRLGEEFFTPGTSSFTEFLAAHRPDPPGTRTLPEGVRAAEAPHGTTILALAHRDGVLVAGDRRATRGSLIAQRDLEKVLPADDHTAIAIAGSVGPAWTWSGSTRSNSRTSRRSRASP